MVRWRDYEENEKGPGGDYGVPTGAANGIVVLDLDVRPGKDGTLALEALGEIPDTLVVSTPSGGFHLYFATDTFVRNSAGVLGPGIDVRGDGGFVVGPGSHHKNGGTYVKMNDVEPAPLPAWLRAALLEKTNAPRTAPTRVLLAEGSPEEAEAVLEAVRICQAEEPAVSGEGGSNRLFRVACRLVKLLLPLDALAFVIQEHFRSEPPWTDGEVMHKLEGAELATAEEPKAFFSEAAVDRMAGRGPGDPARKEPDPQHVYEYHAGMRSLVGKPEDLSHNDLKADLFAHRSWDGVLAWDDFKKRIVATNPPVALDAEGPAGLSDADVNNITGWFGWAGKKARELDVQRALPAVARLRSYNPVQDYLRACAAAWDGVARLDRVLPTYFKTADTAYERGVGPKWFIAMVARAMQPGCQSDQTLILEGQQGVGKSTGLKALMPNPLWYADCTAAIDHKDFLENLRGLWLVGFDELDSLSRGSITKVKTMMTATVDNYRSSYGRNTQAYPRSCGFCGTTNATNYFKDQTGGRRMWPARVLQQIVVADIERDRDQLWGEAASRFFEGEPWHIGQGSELGALCEEQQEERLDEDPWEGAVATWLAKVSLEPVPPAEGPFAGVGPYDASKGITTWDVLTLAIRKEPDRQGHADTQRVAVILRRLGWGRRVRMREGAGLTWRYLRG